MLSGATEATMLPSSGLPLDFCSVFRPISASMSNLVSAGSMLQTHYASTAICVMLPPPFSFLTCRHREYTCRCCYSLHSLVFTIFSIQKAENMVLKRSDDIVTW